MDARGGRGGADRGDRRGPRPHRLGHRSLLRRVLLLLLRAPRGFAFFDRSERYLGKDGILVTAKTAAEVTGAFGRYFERITPLGGVEVGRRGRAEYTLYLYRGERLRTPYPQPYG